MRFKKELHIFLEFFFTGLAIIIVIIPAYHLTYPRNVSTKTAGTKEGPNLKAETDTKAAAQDLTKWLNSTDEGECPNCHILLTLDNFKDAPLDTVLPCPFCGYKATKGELIQKRQKSKKEFVDEMKAMQQQSKKAPPHR